MKKQKKQKTKKASEKKLALSEVLLYPLITEKAVNMIETENKICFIVDKRAGKSGVKSAVEKLYNVKVDSVTIVNDMKGRKKAFVRLNKQFKAEELATKLGVL